MYNIGIAGGTAAFLHGACPCREGAILACGLAVTVLIDGVAVAAAVVAVAFKIKSLNVQNLGPHLGGQTRKPEPSIS